jgi:hypothetical protein
MRWLIRLAVLGFAAVGAKTMYERWSPRVQHVAARRDEVADDVRASARRVGDEVRGVAGDVKREVRDTAREVKRDLDEGSTSAGSYGVASVG